MVDEQTDVEQVREAIAAVSGFVVAEDDPDCYDNDRLETSVDIQGVSRYGTTGIVFPAGMTAIVLAALDGKAVTVEDVRQAILAELACFPCDAKWLADHIIIRLTAKP